MAQGAGALQPREMTPAFEVSSTTTPATVGLEKGEAAHLVPQASSPGQDPRRAPGQPTSRHRGNETESSEAEPYGSQACPVSGESHQRKASACSLAAW